jgi:hypothetical protein
MGLMLPRLGNSGLAGNVIFFGMCLVCVAAGTCLRAQVSSGEGVAFALCARGFGDRFQCLLRPAPAAGLGWWVWGMMGISNVGLRW